MLWDPTDYPKESVFDEMGMRLKNELYDKVDLEILNIDVLHWYIIFAEENLMHFRINFSPPPPIYTTFNLV